MYSILGTLKKLLPALIVSSVQLKLVNAKKKKKNLIRNVELTFMSNVSQLKLPTAQNKREIKVECILRNNRDIFTFMHL